MRFATLIGPNDASTAFDYSPIRRSMGVKG